MKVKTVEYFTESGLHQAIFKENDVDREAEKFAAHLNDRKDVMKSSIFISTQYEDK